MGKGGGKVTSHPHVPTGWAHVGEVFHVMEGGEVVSCVIATIRRVGPNTVRIQLAPHHEVTGPVTKALAEWVGGLPGGWQSIASGNTEYNPMLVRPHDGGMRARIPGPTPLNRPWGAVVDFKGDGLTGAVAIVAACLNNTHVEED